MKTKNKDRIDELKAEIAKLEEEDASFLAMSGDQQVAETLHSMFCHTNHEDGCGWFHEMNRGKHVWSGHAHKRYLEKANILLDFSAKLKMPTGTLVDLIKLINP